MPAISLPPAPIRPHVAPRESPRFTVEERVWAVLIHLSGLTVYVSGLGHLAIPFFLWRWHRAGSDFVNAAGREALNFQLSTTLYGMIIAVLVFGFGLVTAGVPLLIALCLFHMICSVIGAVKAWDGQAWRYPCSLRLLEGGAR